MSLTDVISPDWKMKMISREISNIVTIPCVVLWLSSQAQVFAWLHIDGLLDKQIPAATQAHLSNNVNTKFGSDGNI